MKFNLTLDCGNSAFKDDNNPEEDIYACMDEVARILREVAMHVTGGSVARVLYDSNGNVCGRFILDENPDGL